MSEAIISSEGVEIVPDRPCPYCSGTGHFTIPDYPTLIKLIKGRKGLRSRRPDSDRAYYVWRNVRFTAGLDVTMPMTAAFAVSGDPYVPALDLLVKLVAKELYGVSGAGESRWLRAFGYSVPEDSSHPETANCGGPVCIVDKPYSEQPEMN